MTRPPLPAAARLRADLLRWYDGSARDLPWRSSAGLYEIWISEIMLQQTTVAAVASHYGRFLARFPNVDALAAADEAEVLACWSGLGYYRRARLLHRAARAIVAQDRGRLPRDRAGWAALPGVGDYASGAIASIGLGERVPAVDANARRVICRWLVADPAELSQWTAARLEREAAALVDPARPGDWNQALMDLGALVCRTADPRCGECPVARHCRSRRAGVVDRVPAPAARAAARDVLAAVLVLAWGGRIFLTRPGAACASAGGRRRGLVRRDFSGLFEGMWILPMSPWHAADRAGPDAPPSRRSARSSLEDPRLWLPYLQAHPWPGSLGVGPRFCGVARHVITAHRLQIAVHRCDLGDGRAAKSRSKREFMDEGIPVYDAGMEAGRFWTLAAEGPPVSRLVSKCLRTAGGAGG